MNNTPIPIGPHMARLMENIKEEGAKSSEFTHAEKMALVADGAMDPKEVGLTSAEEAHLQIVPEDKPKFDFGTTLFLQAGVVPMELRAEWAYKETKIILAPSDKTQFLEDYIKENSGTYRIQGALRCGNLEAKFERTYKNPVLGLAAILELAGKQLESAYTGVPTEPTTDNPEALQLEDRKDESPESKI